MHSIIRTATGAAVLGVLLAIAPLALAADSPTVADVDAGNNAALASSYEQEAQSLRAKAQMHVEMLAAYDKSPAYRRQHPGGGLAAMKQHCQKLIDAYTTAADQAEALAKEHKAAAGGN